MSLNLEKYYDINNKYEIGVDEAGRGPLLGRVYAAAVILPKDDSFNHAEMKDSKKFYSKKKIREVAEYIKNNAIAWYVHYEDEKKIDEINILNATYLCMHKCIKNICEQIKDMETDYTDPFLMIDGKFFKPYSVFKDNEIQCLPHICIEKGDGKYTNIAAASILAKVHRDDYIEELCNNYPDLQNKYHTQSNKGYGSKNHLNGIREHGICQFHRKTFGICKTSNEIILDRNSSIQTNLLTNN